MTTKHGSVALTFRQNMRKLELFTTLSDDEIDILVKHARIRSLDKDQVLFHEGDNGDFFAIVIEGSIDIKKHTEHRTPVTITTLRRGATLGEMALIDHETRSASAIAAEPSTFFVLSKQGFETLIEQSPQCGIKVMRKIATILCKTIRRNSAIFATSIE